jgi:hypothetical protein
MHSTLTPEKTASAIWSRIIKPEVGDLTPEVARVILKLGLDAEDHRRVEWLSSKAREGALSPEERSELEEYIRVNNELMILQSKARLSLKKSGRKPS